jgi:DNA polymerase-3 subunit alpha
LCRPGVKEAELYFENRTDLEYDTVEIRDILEPTRGAIVYQEQTMLLMNKLAGWTLGKADSMRKVKNLEEYRTDFLDSCVSNGIDRDVANNVFNRFSLEYSFNKSHAVSYAVVSAICAWLKHYYRKEFMAATMTLEVLGESDKLMEQIRECGKYDINVLLPDVRYSRSDFVAKPQGILFPLTSIKGVGAKAVEAISSMYQNGQDYTSLETFYQNMNTRVLNKKIMINLIKGGAFDFLNPNRNVTLLEYFRLRNEKAPMMQTWSREVCMQYETEVIGMTISAHPLDGYNIPKFNSMPDGEVTTLGLIKQIKVIQDKNNNDMAFVTVENKQDTIEVIFFNRIYATYQRSLYPGLAVRLRGRKDGTKLLLNELQAI